MSVSQTHIYYHNSMYTLLRHANKQLKVTTAHSTTGTFHKNTTSMRQRPNQTGQSLSTQTRLERRTHSHHARTRLKGALLQKINQQKTRAVSECKEACGAVQHREQVAHSNPAHQTWKLQNAHIPQSETNNNTLCFRPQCQVLYPKSHTETKSFSLM